MSDEPLFPYGKADCVECGKPLSQRNPHCICGVCKGRVQDAAVAKGASPHNALKPYERERSADFQRAYPGAGIGLVPISQSSDVPARGSGYAPHL